MVFSRFKERLDYRKLLVLKTSDTVSTGFYEPISFRFSLNKSFIKPFYITNSQYGNIQIPFEVRFIPYQHTMLERRSMDVDTT